MAVDSSHTVATNSVGLPQCMLTRVLAAPRNRFGWEGYRAFLQQSPTERLRSTIRLQAGTAYCDIGQMVADVLHCEYGGIMDNAAFQQIRLTMQRLTDGALGYVVRMDRVLLLEAHMPAVEWQSGSAVPPWAFIVVSEPYFQAWEQFAQKSAGRGILRLVYTPTTQATMEPLIRCLLAAKS